MRQNSGYDFLIVLLAVGFFVCGCSESPEQVARREQTTRLEQERRASLTPQQRETEDKAKAEEKARDEAEAKRKEAEKKAEADLEMRKIDAGTISKEYVLKFLKHPDDARFGFWDVPEIRSNAEQDIFYCSSKVKAKNDFGAALTYQWETIVMLNGDTWELVSCAIDGRTVYESKDLLATLTARKLGKEQSIASAARKQRAALAAEERKADEETRWRTWTDAIGKHKTEARYGGLSSGKVNLTKRDGAKVQVPLDKLCKEDQEWIRQRSQK